MVAYGPLFGQFVWIHSGAIKMQFVKDKFHELYQQAKVKI